MTIQELIAEGRRRKEENQRQLAEAIRLQEEAARKKYEEEWTPILNEVRYQMPPELHHVLVLPDYPVSDRYHSRPIEIALPENAGKIWCETNSYSATPITFEAMRPYIRFDDEDGVWGVFWRRAGNAEVDFLVALAQAAEFSQELPAVQEEADRKNTEFAQETATVEVPPAAPETDHIEEAIYGLRAIDSDEPIWVQVAQAHALIAIAQELRRRNNK